MNIISAGKEIKGYHNKFNRNENITCISCSGAYAGFVSRPTYKFWADDCITIKIINEKYLDKYIYYYIKLLQYKLITKEEDGGIQRGQGQPHVYASDMDSLQIPSLSLDHQQEIVDFLDAQFELYDINLLAKHIKDMPLFNLLIDKKYDLFADALHLIYRKMELDALHIKMDKDKKAVFNIRVNGLDYKEYKLGDVVEIEFGTRITKGQDSVDENEKIKFPVYGGGDITFYT